MAAGAALDQGSVWEAVFPAVVVRAVVPVAPEGPEAAEGPVAAQAAQQSIPAICGARPGKVAVGAEVHPEAVSEVALAAEELAESVEAVRVAAVAPGAWEAELGTVAVGLEVARVLAAGAVASAAARAAVEGAAQAQAQV